MNKNERDQILSSIGVKADTDGVHLTLTSNSQRDALADTIRNADSPVSFGNSPTKVFIEPQGART